MGFLELKLTSGRSVCPSTSWTGSFSKSCLAMFSSRFTKLILTAFPNSIVSRMSDTVGMSPGCLRYAMFADLRMCLQRICRNDLVRIRLVITVSYERQLRITSTICSFADREFYQDWWNSTTWDEFARKWNKPVHVSRRTFAALPCKAKLTQITSCRHSSFDTSMRLLSRLTGSRGSRRLS